MNFLGSSSESGSIIINIFAKKYNALKCFDATINIYNLIIQNFFYTSIKKIDFVII
jgi:hypothetical protein